MAVHLLRHPRPAVAPGVCYGRLDLALAEPVDPALWTDRLPAHLHQVISSPARRCQELARVLSPDFTTDPAWQELDFGAWEGQRWDAIDRAASDPWAADVWHRAPPGGETYAALTARVRAALDALMARPEVQAGAAGIAVVTHAGPMRAVHAWLDGLDPRAVPALALDFGAVLVVDPVRFHHVRSNRMRSDGVCATRVHPADGPPPSPEP